MLHMNNVQTIIFDDDTTEYARFSADTWQARSGTTLVPVPNPEELEQRYQEELYGTGA